METFIERDGKKFLVVKVSPTGEVLVMDEVKEAEFVDLPPEEEKKEEAIEQKIEV
jgi:hypothetical protein